MFTCYYQNLFSMEIMQLLFLLSRLLFGCSGLGVFLLPL